MAGNQQEGLGVGDDFFEQILAVPPGFGGGGGGEGGEVGSTMPMLLQLGSGGGSGGSGGGDCGGYRGMGLGMGMGMMPLGLNLQHGFLRHEDGVLDGRNSSHNASCSATPAVSGISVIHSFPFLFL